MVSRVISETCRDILQNEAFQLDYFKLAKGELYEKTLQLSEEEVGRLLKVASLFALNSHDVYQKLALNISIYLLNQYRNEYPFIPEAVEVILTRLGDLPTIRSMLKNEHGCDSFNFFNTMGERDISVGAYLRFPEVFKKKLTNQIMTSNGQTLSLTDFQAKVFDTLIAGHSLAFSAPTSTGKSFILHNFISEALQKNQEYCAVYIAPTKALISEVQDSILQTAISNGVNANAFGIFRAYNRLNYIEVSKFAKKIFVLTQERLQESMDNYTFENVKLIVVDEAHKIGDGSRGIIVEDAVQELINRNPDAQKVFICPYIENPQDFRNIFNINHSVITQQTAKSPVGQVIFSIDLNDKLATIRLLTYDFDKNEGQKVLLGQTIAYNIEPSKEGYRAWVVNNLVPKGEPTIVYCDKPADCRLTAKRFVTEIDYSTTNELAKAIKFLKTHVHKDYYLCDSLEKRIGYHYGKMPQFVRFHVKRLFEDKKIDLLCCTSTLLEGVNLPAKNIVLYDPKTGRPYMDRISILNLAGRAGRLFKDYYGKIYCINLTEWNEGKSENVFEPKLEALESSVEKVLEKKMRSLIRYLEDKNYQPPKSVRALGTSLIVKQLRYPNDQFVDRLKERTHISQDYVDKIKTLLSSIEKTRLLDKSVYLKSASFDPRHQDDLYVNLKNFGYYPLPNPSDNDFYQEFLKIFKQISVFLLRKDAENHSYIYFTNLAYRWINENSYKQLVDNKIRESELNAPLNETEEMRKDRINLAIDTLDYELERSIKYNYTRALKCYFSIAQEVMRQKDDRSINFEDLPTFLEAGTKSRLALMLIEMGLSRNAAIDVKNIMINEGIEANTVADCVDWLQNNKMKFVRLPDFYTKEIETLLAIYKEKEQQPSLSE